MPNLADKIAEINHYISRFVWGTPMLFLIIGVGAMMTLRTRFFQIRRIGLWHHETIFAIFRNRSVTKTSDKKALSQFQTLSTALAATIGTGNIAGVATAVTVGGPGAVFWMWVSAVLGMMTIFSENVLGIYYRKKNPHGEWAGGAMYYIEEGLKSKKPFHKIAKPLAVLFSVFCVFASFGIGNMTQVNSISSALNSTFQIPTMATGIVVATLAALVIVGGIKRIGKVTEKLVPVMALCYIIGAGAIFVMNYKQIPYVFKSIFAGAFSNAAILGGISGTAIKKAISIGFKRGVFSNEAGLGSSVTINSSSDVKEPCVQGMWGIFEVFVDTIIVCTATAFVILSCTVTSSSNVTTLDKALENVTLKPQYFELYDGERLDGDTINLVDWQANKTILTADKHTDPRQIGDTLIATTENGQKITVETLRVSPNEEDNYIYTNIMSLTGVPKTDKDGNILVDQNGSPVIESVKFEKVNGVPLVSFAFSQHFGSFAGKFISIAIVLFAFSTLIGWSFNGTKAMEYLLGTRSTIFYKILFVIFVGIGAVMSLDLAWAVSDTLNGLMAIPNLIALLFLSGDVVKITDNYLSRRIKGKKIKPILSAYPDIQMLQENSGTVGAEKSGH